MAAYINIPSPIASPESVYGANKIRRSESHYSTQDSPADDDVHHRTNHSLPSFWTASSHYSCESLIPPPESPSRFASLFRGWRLIILGSWLNTLLVLIPVAWALSITRPQAYGLKFTFCILSLIPLVKLHEISTRELALRIGGSKTGLANVSMSNSVVIVIAISALRKCELHVVQSSLIGSMLSKLLLVLGLCFFAGGTQFSEQTFDPTATQVDSSLLSISVGAILLPGVYHFALSGTGTTIPQWQQRNILHMSHGVSIAMLCLYVAYLVFQLWSHSHLYKDTHNKTNLYRSSNNQSVDDLSRPIPLSLPRRLYVSISSSTSSSTSRFALARINAEKNAQGAATESTVRLVGNTGGYPMTRDGTGYTGSGSSNASTRIGEGVTDSEKGFVDSQQPSPPVPDEEATSALADTAREGPRVSWFLTILLLIVVTIATSFTADLLVISMDGISSKVSKEWVGLILLPAVTAVTECMMAVNVSVKDQLTLSISVAVGSTIQTALFVIPLMVTLAWAMGKPLSLLMDPFQSLVLFIAVQTTSSIVVDGKSNWLEGLILICLYSIIAISFWFYPGSNLLPSLMTCAAPA
ncbi:Vacuolar calcium ion transporter [Hypsizygus marmoreus]|uniref:Vacuolar calcium ion transporter n=1 Tax=Hypsizygus marmoreus TaxID=39966 RepID=A0A369K3Y2_HYPMA|nr:Vacuolar calcium ion transporter [Hypsizygus marmoreus]